MNADQLERKRAKQRECMRRLRAAMTPEQLDTKRAANREYMRITRVERPELARAAERRYRETNRDELAFRAFCRHQDNPDVANIRRSAWSRANPERQRQLRRASAKRCAARPENRAASQKKARLRHIRNCSDPATLALRIVAAADAAMAKVVSPQLRSEVRPMLIEAVYSGRFPIRIKPEHAQELLREHFRQFSKFDSVSLDEVIGEDGFTRGAALGIYS